MTQDELEEKLSIQFEKVGDLFDWDGGLSADDFNVERDEFIMWGIKLINQCIKGGGVESD